jgi:magnesium-protoporphyrin O-methyltransferase
MSTSTSYVTDRGRIEAYFDRTALSAWAQLTSDAPVSRIRATVREGRDRMRANLLDWLPADLSGKRLLDAGCGTGALAVEAARRGAEVVAIDISGSLISIAQERMPDELSIEWRVGDMCDPALGDFDHVVAMDSLIHYRPDDTVRVLATLAERARGSIAFTFAPRTALLGGMLAIGKLFPRRDSSPALEPVAHAHLRERLGMLPGWSIGRDQFISSGFYKSHALELVRRP